MKIALIVPYFGTLPNYFHLFLKSCGENPDFDWLIITDDNTDYAYPENVHRISMTFLECTQLVREKFDFAVSLEKPQKLCDYKPAYGYVFSEYLSNYDWWGYCDLDQIFGCLGMFVTPDRLEKYDKIYSLGHLTLYRNTEENNQIFMLPLNGKNLYQEVLSSPYGMAFDEWIPGNVNEIFLSTDIPALYDNDGADIDPYHTTFRLVAYDVQNRKYERSPIKNSIFQWNQGHLYQIYLKNGTICKREFPYAHFQKRRMLDCRADKGSDSFYAMPNQFVDGNVDPVCLLKKSQMKSLVYSQYIKVKYNSLKQRVRTGNWKAQNVFK